MERMRVAVTVLPVGPRSDEVLGRNDRLWFALQISAGFVGRDPLMMLWTARRQDCGAMMVAAQVTI